MSRSTCFLLQHQMVTSSRIVFLSKEPSFESVLSVVIVAAAALKIVFWSPQHLPSMVALFYIKRAGAPGIAEGYATDARRTTRAGRKCHVQALFSAAFLQAALHNMSCFIVLFFLPSTALPRAGAGWHRQDHLAGATHERQA